MWLLLHMMVRDYFSRGEILTGLRLLRVGFAKFDLAVVVWSFLFISTCIVFICFHVWTRIRCRLKPKSLAVTMWDWFWIVATGSYYILFYNFTIKVIKALALPEGWSCVLLVETTRLLMKTHAFLRSSSEEVARYKPHTEQSLPHKRFSSFLYFLFAPTLVYRDEYPRTHSIRWRFVFQNIVEAIVAMLILVIIVENEYVRTYEDFGKRTYTWQEIMLKLSANSVTGLVIKLIFFYFLLHSWHNFFAEILTFSDRLFYKDWWMSTTYSRFYRTWNAIVHDWLYTYIYKDMCEHLLDNKGLAKLTVLFVSALVHEVILSYSLKMFFPALFFLFFGTGIILAFTTAPDNFLLHTLFLFGESLGSALLLNLYTMEYYARANRPVMNATLVDYLKPRIFTCDCIQ